MKTIILAFLVSCVAALPTHAADEPLIPTPLNNVLLRIRRGMTTNQVRLEDLWKYYWHLDWRPPAVRPE